MVSSVAGHVLLEHVEIRNLRESTSHDDRHVRPGRIHVPVPEIPRHVWFIERQVSAARHPNLLNPIIRPITDKHLWFLFVICYREHISVLHFEMKVLFFNLSSYQINVQKNLLFKINDSFLHLETLFSLVEVDHRHFRRSMSVVSRRAWWNPSSKIEHFSRTMSGKQRKLSDWLRFI